MYTKMRSHLQGALPLVLMLLLFSAQTISLQHDHDGDLSNHTDCSICFKKSHDTYFLIADVSIGSAELLQMPAILPEKDLVSFHPVISRSRSPPAS